MHDRNLHSPFIYLYLIFESYLFIHNYIMSIFIVVDVFTYTNLIS